MDLLKVDRWLTPLLFSDNSEQVIDSLTLEEQPLNPYFEENGFSSKVAIKNLGSTFVYICIFALIVLQLPLLALLSKNSIKISLLY